ncbi:unnamed protein product, partial [Nesidiocoris tenuis]
MTMEYRKLGDDDDVGATPLSRGSAIRSSLRRMGARLGMGSAEEGPRKVPPGGPPKLPVVSFYSGRDGDAMRLVRRKSSLKDRPKPLKTPLRTTPLKTLKDDLSSLSPNSRLRVGRLVKTLGPEAYEAVRREVAERRKSSAVRRNFRGCPSDTLNERRFFQRPLKRRRSLSDLAHIDEEGAQCENRPPGIISFGTSYLTFLLPSYSPEVNLRQIVKPGNLS